MWCVRKTIKIKKNIIIPGGTEPGVRVVVVSSGRRRRVRLRPGRGKSGSVDYGNTRDNNAPGENPDRHYRFFFFFTARLREILPEGGGLPCTRVKTVRVYRNGSDLYGEKRRRGAGRENAFIRTRRGRPVVLFFLRPPTTVKIIIPNPLGCYPVFWYIPVYICIRIYIK